MTASELREEFLEFFKSKGHKIVPSDALVPREDPTLLFTSAGMNQFKDQFLGRNITYRRVASCQKCLRTADLEKVGKTPYHHTFFEMLGNFSFGDYFKQEALSWAWEFMTDVLKFPERKLWVSVYKDDDEAYSIWKDRVKVPKNRIVKLGDEENFWPANAKKEGPNGPCGPCAEIFYDWGKKIGCKRPGCNPSCDCGRFVEVWNLVFTQFNRTGVDKLEPLSNKNIDTGMGLERLASVVQGVHTNFETDLFKPIIDAITKLLKTERGTRDEGRGTTIYAIADHIRAINFAILDGVMPSNEGRGYVIRKLIRTSYLHGRALGIKGPFLYKLTFSVAKAMKAAYPEIGRRHEDIAGVIKSEEEFFEQNLDIDRAEVLYEQKFKEFHPSSQEEITVSAAKVACFLNDTYGIPPDLTKEIAKSKNHIFNEALWEKTYTESIESLRELSRKGSAFLKETIFAETEASKIASSVQKTEFVGHKLNKTKAKIIKIFKDGQEIKELRQKGDIQIILDETPFYAEAGGQVGDSGSLKKEGVKINIIDTKRVEAVTVHIGKLIEGSIRVGGEVEAEVDGYRRQCIAKNHTATHLLQNALRKVLGEHVHQSGSVVDENRLRFDFTHSKKVSASELKKIERMVNGYIQNSDAVKTDEDVELDRARDEGAIALFGEKYSKHVRVVTIGGYSKELCGGTHVAKTSEVGLFKIISEGSIAAGLRRIEAVTNSAVDEHVIKEEIAIIRELKENIDSVESMVGDLDNVSEIKTRASKILAKAKEIKPTIEKPLSYERYLYWEDDAKPSLVELIEILKELKAKIEKNIFSSKLEKSKTLSHDIIKSASRIANTLIIAKAIEDADSKILSFLSDEIKKNIESGIIVLATQKENRISFICAITSDLVKKGLHAGRLVERIAAITGGGGGGREDFALAGGKDPSKLNEALNSVYEISKDVLKRS